MSDEIVCRINELDRLLRESTGMPRNDDARSLDQAITQASETTSRVLAAAEKLSPDASEALTEFLRMQLRAHEVRASRRAEVVRSLTAGIRRMRTTESLQRLGRQARAMLCESLGFEQALLSFIEEDGFVVEESEQCPGGPTVIPRRYCRAEQACIQSRDTVETTDSAVPATSGYRELLGTGRYLVAPVVVKSRVVALLHVSRGDRGGFCSDDANVLDAFASAYSLLYEKVLNAEHLAQQRESIARAAARLTEEADRIAAATISFDIDDDHAIESHAAVRSSTMTASLSEREHEVFERLIMGASNADIAEDLVITVETVKTHVKRILRKIGAINRSEAIALYLDETKPTTQNKVR